MCSTHSPRARQFLRSDAEFGSHSGWLMGMHVSARCAPPPLSLPPPWITKFSVVEHMQRAYKIESSAHATAHRSDTSQQMNNRSRTEEETKIMKWMLMLSLLCGSHTIIHVPYRSCVSLDTFHTYIVCVNFFTIAIYTINFCRKRQKNSEFFLLVMTFKFIKYTRQSYKVLLDHGTNEFLFSNEDSDERPNQMRHAFRRIFWLCLSLCMFISAWCLPSIR